MRLTFITTYPLWEKRGLTAHHETEFQIMNHKVHDNPFLAFPVVGGFG